MWRWRSSPTSRPRGAAAVPGGLHALDHAGGVAAAAGHLVLHGPDFAPAIRRRVGRAALELADQPRRLRARARRGERHAPLEGELAQIALLARRRGGSGG